MNAHYPPRWGACTASRWHRQEDRLNNWINFHLYHHCQPFCVTEEISLKLSVCNMFGYFVSIYHVFVGNIFFFHTLKTTFVWYKYIFFTWVQWSCLFACFGPKQQIDLFLRSLWARVRFVRSGWQNWFWFWTSSRQDPADTNQAPILVPLQAGDQKDV